MMITQLTNLTFNNGDEVNKFFYDKPSYKEWKSNLTGDMESAIYNYSEIGYYDINEYLRGNFAGNQEFYFTFQPLKNASFVVCYPFNVIKM